jgi:hypothetical protein
MICKRSPLMLSSYSTQVVPILLWGSLSFPITKYCLSRNLSFNMKRFFEPVIQLEASPELEDAMGTHIDCTVVCNRGRAF